MNHTEPATATWFKSSRSNAHANCVEVAFLNEGRVGLRDRRTGSRPRARLHPSREAFLAGAKDGEFDLPA
ncbi:DUF397 domain-containing protein [Pseudonocardia sp. CA-142604]|uniref:DUF397 domain-containing protein n=1 Tax=Pseudonocardia sp. CA-142604 TaxID=3240024 RepID=UPI003D8F85F6